MDTTSYNEQNLSPFMRFIENYITPLYITVVYLGAITLGLYFHSILIQSPLIKFISKGTGMLMSAISWIPAYFIGGIVFNKFQFAENILHLYLNTDFKITSAIILLSIPVVLLTKRIIMQLKSPLIFWSLTIVLIIFVSFSVEYIFAFQYSFSYIWTFSIIGIIYYPILKQ